MNILQDIKTAVKVTNEVRKARKAGANAVQIKPVYTVPMLKTGLWPWTMEACLMRGGEVESAVVAVFETFPHEVQRSLTFTPTEPGGWADRARFWQRQLKTSLPVKAYHDVMILFLGWYSHCLRMRKEATP